MKIIKKTLDERLKVNLLDIPLESNLGLLAYGDIAFEAWRKIKKNSKSNSKNEAK